MLSLDGQHNLHEYETLGEFSLALLCHRTRAWSMEGYCSARSDWSGVHESGTTPFSAQSTQAPQIHMPVV